MLLYKKKWIEPFENKRDYPFFYYLELFEDLMPVIGQHSIGVFGQIQEGITGKRSPLKIVFKEVIDRG